MEEFFVSGVISTCITNEEERIVVIDGTKTTFSKQQE
jgi:hypothetical protein